MPNFNRYKRFCHSTMSPLYVFFLTLDNIGADGKKMSVKGIVQEDSKNSNRKLTLCIKSQKTVSETS